MMNDSGYAEENVTLLCDAYLLAHRVASKDHLELLFAVALMMIEEKPGQQGGVYLHALKTVAENHGFCTG